MARNARHTKTRTCVKPRFFIFLLVILAVLAGVFFIGDPFNLHHEAADPVPVSEPEEPVEVPDEIVSLSMLCAGDAMVHKAQWLAAETGNGTYDFREPFTYIKKYVEEADLAVVNVETTFAGDAPEGYPAFCTPDEFATALRWTGFDVANTANNHMIDKRTRGVLRTLQVLRDNNIATVGSHYDWEHSYTIYNVKGLRIGFVTATYETHTGTSAHALNGITVPDDALPLINTFRSTDYSFSETEYQTDLARITGQINAARKDGADIVVCFLHWGQEYNLKPNSAQERMAQDLADAGCDVIFASHPHVIQPATVLTSAKTGNAVPVYYSLGNLVSNQRRETLPNTPNNVYTEETVLARVNFTYNKTKGCLESVESDAVPCWLDKYTSGGKVHYALIPLDSEFESNPALKTSGHLSYAQDALTKITNVVGAEFIAK